MLHFFYSELEVHGRGWSFSGAGYGVYETHTHKSSREGNNCKATLQRCYAKLVPSHGEEVVIHMRATEYAHLQHHPDVASAMVFACSWPKLWGSLNHTWLTGRMCGVCPLPPNVLSAVALQSERKNITGAGL